MTEVKTTTEVKNFDDLIHEFDEVEKVEQKAGFSTPKESSFEKVLETQKEEEKVELEVKTEVKAFDQIEKEVEKEIETDEVIEEKVITPAIYSALNKLVDEGSFFLFEGKDNLSEYTEEELIELLKENDTHKKAESVEKEISEFFNSLPEELQFAAKYVADGGKDLKGLFKTLSATQEVKSLNPKKDGESIIRNYYGSLDWEEADIDEKIATLKDLGEAALEKEATQLKPKLDKMFEETIKTQLANQEIEEKNKKLAAQKYHQSAIDAIKTGKLGDIALDKKTQIDLYTGLTQPNYTTRRGTQTNELGHLLEKFQYTEPNFEKMYKVLWLLKDEDAFFDKFSAKKVKENTEKTVRTLKTEQSKKEAASVEIGDAVDKIKRKVIKRNVPSFMSGIND